MVSLRDEERWVVGCVQAALPDVAVGQHDDNMTPRAHDLDLCVGNGRTFGAIEVTAAADPEVVQSWKLLTGRGERWIESGLAGGWLINVRPNTRIKRLRKELPRLLKVLEDVGCTSLLRPLDGNDPLCVAAAQVGVVSAMQSGTDFPGSIYVMLEIPFDRRVCWVAPTGDALSEWIAAWIVEPSRADNLEKPRKSTARERHLFVIVPGLSSTAPASVTDLLMRSDAPLPTVSPALPPGVTHVWVASTWTSGQGFRWSSECGWDKFPTGSMLDPSRLVSCACQ